MTLQITLASVANSVSQASTSARRPGSALRLTPVLRGGLVRNSAARRIAMSCRYEQHRPSRLALGEAVVGFC